MVRRRLCFFCFLLVVFIVVAAPFEPSTKAWPFLAGHPALAQSDAPAADTSGQDAAPDDMTDAAPDGDPDVTAVDDIHHAIGSGLKGAGAWLDSFFSTEHEDAENNNSRLRVIVGGSVEKGSDAKLSLRVKARLALPQINKHLSLVVDGDGDSDSSIQNNENDDARENYNSTNDQNAAVGLEYSFFQTKRRSLAAVAGIRFKGDNPVGVFGGRYRETWELDQWELRFTQEGLWLTDNGFALPTRFDLDRPIVPNWHSRTTLKGDWYESEDGYYYEANQWINHRIDNKRGVSFQWNNQFQTSPSNRVEETNLRIRYRQLVWRDWLILEIAPQLAFPRDRDFRITPGIYGGFEVRFGG